MNISARPFKQAITALGAGIVVGVALVTALGFFSTSSDAILPPATMAEVSFVASLFYGCIVAVLCIPIWLLISKCGLDGPVAAVALGFVMTSAVWFFANQPFFGPTLYDLAIAGCGAAAGLGTWWTGNRR